MPLYTYVCDACGQSVTKLRKIDARDEPIHCAGNDDGGHVGEGPLMRRTFEMPAVHYKGYGWTRTPAILSDPIAAGVNAQQGKVNWGTASAAEFGDGSED